MNTKKLAVVGCGTMGSGIAQVAVQSGLQVVAVERDEAAAKGAEARVAKGLDRLVRRERITAEDQAAALALLSSTTDLGAVGEADVVIEAIYEDVGQKKALFAEVARLAAPDALLASNTSTIPLVILAAATDQPERVIGLHFFNPVPAMKLVEVIRTPASDPAVVEAGRQFAADLGKSPVLINDVPGFVGNLLVVPYLLDAIRAYERSVAEKEAIDDVIRLGFNHPMGPFALADLIGLDIVHDMAASMYEEYKDPRYVPPPLLKQYVRMGWLGRKTGRGFYTYDR
ncbi:3-hydroxyacyl-CoA dehydrogenase family protein [Phytohabitans sp. ZYX-F-186]|uniref:3-hydroxyacyl-CoA dehydrogenase family protein n=1 Tax=Phytohabitans maris TaxID=3071409 RepID=A0ABU0ZRI5_9ACTN|nr:3-hydroxyacyl-CoA dehydrogenase family protein [Phytohabitans sp. ZYX-F-186]MDQ7908557.1 3-hydroxyacyl-CoA dehydrogenase family protein [Phytohabitans sp. ZYX-F-186]